MSGALKKTTGLTGLAVVALPRETLKTIYENTLRALQCMPQDYIYRQCTEKVIKERADIVNKNTDVSVIENKIGSGQIEEVIMQAKYELSLAKRMTYWKPWEKLVEEAPVNQWVWPPHK